MDVRKSILKTPISYLIISINILVFLLLNIFPKLDKFFLLDPNNFTVYPWTLITVFFSQQIIIHILANMGLFFVFGRPLERLIGSKNLFLIYMISGILGSISILIYAPLINWEGLIPGASASTFGVASAYGAIKPNEIILKEKAKYWVVALFVVNTILMILNPRTSIGGIAHILGILAGLIYGKLIIKNISQI